MSYAEHGSRIFLTGKFNSNSLLRYGDYVVPRKRSEGRLKLFDSCSDIRAWSPNSLENCRYFREIVENRGPSGRIVPYNILIETLILLGQTELASVRRQLEKYKSLRLTPEQKKQLRDSDDSAVDNVKGFDSSLIQETRSIEDDQSGVPERPGTPTQSICSSSSNFQEIDNDHDYSGENTSEGSKDIDVSAEINGDNLQLDEMKRYQSIIIEKDSKIIALKNELIAKETELEDTKDLCGNLESSLNNYRKNVKNYQEQILDINNHFNRQKEEWIKKIYTSNCMVDRLKNALSESPRECAAHYEEIRHLRAGIKEIENVQDERDSLIRRLDEMKIVVREKNDLLKCNKKQASTVADLEDEVNRLVALNKRTSMKLTQQEVKMKSELDSLNAKLEAKNFIISQIEEQHVTVRTNLSPPTRSLSQIPIPEIKKFKEALLDDLDAIEKELMKRPDSWLHTNSRNEEIPSDSKITTNQTNEATPYEKWEREKELMECTIEQLTMQVSAMNANNNKWDAIYGKFVEDSQKCYAEMQRLIVELEPYEEQRLDLLGEIKRLGNEIEDAKIFSASRDAEKITYLEKKMSVLRKRNADDEKMDEEIDRVWVIHEKRSIETMRKLTAGLRGAGDEIDREKAKRHDEVEIRDAEITRLREQVALHVSRGQGDEMNNENLNKIVRLGNEKKRLSNELATTKKELSEKKNELQSFDFMLKGSKQCTNDLSAQIKKKERDMEFANRRIKTLTKEKECLDKTVMITNDLATEVDAMKIKLESLQEENSRLINKNVTFGKVSADHKNQILDLSDRQMQAKDAFDRAEFEFQKRAVKSEIVIEELRRENEMYGRELETSQGKITKLKDELKWLRKNNKVFDWMENFTMEMSKLSEDRRKLQNDVIDCKYRLENNYRVNVKLEDDLKCVLSENETLENAIREMSIEIERISGKEMPKEVAKNLIETLPNTIHERIKHLRKDINLMEYEGHSLHRELKDLKTKSMEDESVMEKLREEIKILQKKSHEQNEKIVLLEEANEALARSLKKFEANENSIRAKSQATWESEIGKKELEIMELKREIETKNEELKILNERVEMLNRAKNELVKKLKNEEDSRQAKYMELQQQYKIQLRGIRDEHNVSIKKLKAQYDEQANNEGKNFNTETWLQSLKPNEMSELHTKICASISCEMLGDGFKTRALNDMQNQQLQQDDKLAAFHMKKEHQKESLFGFPYIYEKRKFENARHRPLEKCPDHNYLIARRNNFLHQCAILHKHDSSH